MPSMIIVTRDGLGHAIESATGQSLMEAIRESGIDDIQALCGGCRSCASCHVHVDPAFADRLSPMGDDENDLLDSSSTRDENSRLSCQISVTAELEGLKVRIAAED
jgi:ferredoxin, 2Fe-2S